MYYNLKFLQLISSPLTDENNYYVILSSHGYIK